MRSQAEGPHRWPSLKHLGNRAVSLSIKKDSYNSMEQKQALSDIIPWYDLDCPAGYVHVFDYLEPTDEVWVPQACSRPWCLRCEPIRVHRLGRKLRAYLEGNPGKLWLVTRSVRNCPALTAAFNTLRYTQKRFNILAADRRLKTHPFRVAKAWVAVTEITHDLSTGFNVHEHMLWVTDQGVRLDYAELHHYWDKAAGYPAQLNVVELRSIHGGVSYVAKYLSKGIWGGLSSGRAYLNRVALKGRNRINSKRGTIPKRLRTGKVFCCTAECSQECNGEGWSP